VAIPGRAAAAICAVLDAAGPPQRRAEAAQRQAECDFFVASGFFKGEMNLKQTPPQQDPQKD
jgi:hypothetical protein